MVNYESNAKVVNSSKDDLDLNRNATNYRDKHKYRGEITINIEMQWK